MSDDKGRRSAQDRDRVNIHEEYEVEYWTRKWGVDRDALKAAVEKVGPSADAIARELGK